MFIIISIIQLISFNNNSVGVKSSPVRMVSHAYAMLFRSSININYT
jgi:hypothetical protein